MKIKKISSCIFMILSFPGHLIYKFLSFITSHYIMEILSTFLVWYYYIPHFKDSGGEKLFYAIVFCFINAFVTTFLSSIMATGTDLFGCVDIIYLNNRKKFFNKGYTNAHGKRSRTDYQEDFRNERNSQNKNSSQNKSSSQSGQKSFIDGYNAGYKKAQSELSNRMKANTELNNALSIFMLDKVVPLDELNKRKNFLLKKFHPDANSEDTTDMTVKILHAYEVLTKYCPK